MHKIDRIKQIDAIAQRVRIYALIAVGAFINLVFWWVTR